MRLDNRMRDVTRTVIIPPSNYFDFEGHHFKHQSKFIIKEQLHQTNLDKPALQKRLKVRENFWIETLETLHAKGLNRELKVHGTQKRYKYSPCFKNQ